MRGQFQKGTVAARCTAQQLRRVRQCCAHLLGVQTARQPVQALGLSPQREHQHGSPQVPVATRIGIERRGAPRFTPGYRQSRPGS